MDSEICRAHREVTEGNLHMKRARHHVADHDEDEATIRIRNTSINDTIAEPSPEEDMPGDFEPSVPPRNPFSRT